MSKEIGAIFKKYFLNKILPIFSKKKELIQEQSVVDVVKDEVNGLWDIVNKMNEDGQESFDVDFQKELMKSFNYIKERFTNEELEKSYAWIRYVNVMIHSKNPTNEYLIKYISADNYIFLTNRLYNLTKSIHKENDRVIVKNIEKFNEDVWHYILNNINSNDIPSCLALGKAAQKRKNYEEARKWYTRVMEMDEPFNGVTSILACYEEETKEMLANIRKSKRTKTASFEKVHELNLQQEAIYKKWSDIMEKYLNSGDDITEQYKREYISLIAGYARFERNKGNYKGAMELLEKVPDTFPDIHRIYAEEAMLYQHKTYKNSYYSLDKSIDTFKKAYDAISKHKGSKALYNKSMKSILIPLANSYFYSKRYDEAEEICDRVLKMDSKEKSAIKLKNKIASINV